MRLLETRYFQMPCALAEIAGSVFETADAKWLSYRIGNTFETVVHTACRKPASFQ